jgi:hypothetical protein
VGKVANIKETPARLLTLPFRLVVVLFKLLVLLVAIVGMPYVAIPTVALLFLGRRNRG